jgi:hypothetical protein
VICTCEPAVISATGGAVDGGVRSSSGFSDTTPVVISAGVGPADEANFSLMIEGAAVAGRTAGGCGTSGCTGFGLIGTGSSECDAGAADVGFSDIFVVFVTAGFLGARGFFCLSSNTFCCSFVSCSSALGTFSLMLIFFMPFVKFSTPSGFATSWEDRDVSRLMPFPSFASAAGAVEGIVGTGGTVAFALRGLAFGFAGTFVAAGTRGFLTGAGFPACPKATEGALDGP